MTLQEELDAAAEGSTVHVASGVHRGTLVIRKSITLSGDSFGSTLDGAAAGPVVIVSGSGIRVTLENLVLRGGSVQAGGGVVFERGAELVLRGCTVRANAATGFGGGAVYARGERLLVDRCQLLENRARQGGALLIDQTCAATVVSTVIAGNRAIIGGAIRVQEGAQLELSCSTVADNAVEGKGATGSQLHVSGTMTRTPIVRVADCILAGASPVVWNQGEYPAQVEVSHTLVPADDPQTGAHVFHGDPRFRGSGAQPYALTPESPAIGAGDPTHVPAEASDLTGQPRVRAGKLDLGALSFAATQQ